MGFFSRFRKIILCVTSLFSGSIKLSNDVEVAYFNQQLTRCEAAKTSMSKKNVFKKCARAGFSIVSEEFHPLD
jgi:hypothetical protein